MSIGGSLDPLEYGIFSGLEITIFSHFWSQKLQVMIIYQEKIYFFYDFTSLHYTCSVIKACNDFRAFFRRYILVIFSPLYLFLYLPQDLQT